MKAGIANFPSAGEGCGGGGGGPLPFDFVSISAHVTIFFWNIVMFVISYREIKVFGNKSVANVP